ncbi:MAG TPA: hypothetical protein VJB87_01980 [Candidatus Nanoarchaeia archaeon]|nr:hypothetical protein [Candidatus Nanoarchaeia archaeon]
MPTITINVSEGLKKKLDQHPIFNWSAIAREAIQKKIELQEALETFSKDSTMTEKDAIIMGRTIKKAMWEDHYKNVFGKSSEKRQQLLKKN